MFAENKFYYKKSIMKLFNGILFILLVMLCQNVCFGMHRSEEQQQQNSPTNSDFVGLLGVTQNSHTLVGNISFSA